MLFARVASKLGIEMVKVDTKILNPQLSAGQRLQGEIHFYGISTAQQINGVRLDLMVETRFKSRNVGSGSIIPSPEITSYSLLPFSLETWHYHHTFRLPAYQNYVLPFAFVLPNQLPMNDGFGRYYPVDIGVETDYKSESKIWLETHLDVDWHLDAQDRDYLTFPVTPFIQQFIDMMAQCGFKFSGECIKNNQHYKFANLDYCEWIEIPYYQSFLFSIKPSMMEIYTIEVVFNVQHDGIHILFKPDSKYVWNVAGIGFNMNGWWRLIVSHHDVDMQQLTLQIKQLLKLS